MIVRLVAEGDAFLPQLRQPLAVDLNAVGSGSRGVVPEDKVIRSAIIFRVDAEKFEAIDTYMVDYGD